MANAEKQTLIDIDKEAAQPTAKMSQPKIRTLAIFTIVAVILGLVVAAEIVWLLNIK